MESFSEHTGAHQVNCVVGMKPCDSDANYNVEAEGSVVIHTGIAEVHANGAFHMSGTG